MTTDNDTTTEEQGDGHGGDAPQYNHLELVESLGISDEAADEVAKELSGDLGLIKDHSFDGRYFIVRWHDGE